MDGAVSLIVKLLTVTRLQIKRVLVLTITAIRALTSWLFSVQL